MARRGKFVMLDSNYKFYTTVEELYKCKPIMNEKGMEGTLTDEGVVKFDNGDIRYFGKDMIVGESRILGVRNGPEITNFLKKKIPSLNGNDGRIEIFRRLIEYDDIAHYSDVINRIKFLHSVCRGRIAGLTLSPIDLGLDDLDGTPYDIYFASKDSGLKYGKNEKFSPLAGDIKMGIPILLLFRRLGNVFYCLNDYGAQMADGALVHVTTNTNAPQKFRNFYAEMLRFKAEIDLGLRMLDRGYTVVGFAELSVVGADHALLARHMNIALYGFDMVLFGSNTAPVSAGEGIGNFHLCENIAGGAGNAGNPGIGVDPTTAEMLNLYTAVRRRYLFADRGGGLAQNLAPNNFFDTFTNAGHMGGNFIRVEASTITFETHHLIMKVAKKSGQSMYEIYEFYVNVGAPVPRTYFTKISSRDALSASERELLPTADVNNAIRVIYCDLAVFRTSENNNSIYLGSGAFPTAHLLAFLGDFGASGGFEGVPLLVDTHTNATYLYERRNMMKNIVELSRKNNYALFGTIMDILQAMLNCATMRTKYNYMEGNATAILMSLVLLKDVPLYSDISRMFRFAALFKFGLYKSYNAAGNIGFAGVNTKNRYNVPAADTISFLARRYLKPFKKIEPKYLMGLLLDFFLKGKTF